MSKKDRKHSDPNRCDCCSYDFTGLPDDGQCPECGRSIMELRAEIHQRHIGPAVHRKLDRSVPCAQCGYELEGLLLESACPECGTPLNDSLGGRLLRYAPVDQLKRLSVASQWLFWASIIILVEFCSDMSSGLVAVMWSIGLVRFARASSSDVRGRKFAIIASIIMFVLVAVDLINTRPGLGIDSTVLTTVLIATLAITITAGFLLIEDVASCLPNRRTILDIRNLRWTLPVPVAFVIGVLWRNQLGAIPPVVVVIFATATAVWYFIFVLFLWEFARHLRDEHQYVKAVGELGSPVPPETPKPVDS